MEEFNYSCMDLRDYYAAKAMQAILTGSAWNISHPNEVATKAYKYADAMMAARQVPRDEASGNVTGAKPQ